jgi:hypothetical protein
VDFFGCWMAGVYAMTGLADDWEENRQTCVDVLCAYLRMPYEPDAGQDAPEPKRLTFRASREVRHTVIWVIAAHLKHHAATSWQGLNFDFSSVVFDGGNFSGQDPSGGYFDSAVFSSGVVSFEHAEFSSGIVFFNGAEFSGSDVFSDGPSSLAATSGLTERYSPAVRSAFSTSRPPMARLRPMALCSPVATSLSTGPSTLADALALPVQPTDLIRRSSAGIARQGPR